MNQETDDGLQVFVSEDGEFRLFPRLRRYETERQEFIADPYPPLEGEPGLEVCRFHPVGEQEDTAARALLAERDELRGVVAFLLEFTYRLLAGSLPPPLPDADSKRWRQLYRQYEHEEWFRKQSG